MVPAQNTACVQGWDGLVLPAVSYNTDLGFHYGVYGNAFYYGRDTLCTYPTYQHYINAELSRYTGGQTLAFLQYDSPQLIKGGQLTFIAKYQVDTRAPFYGFNGYAEPYLNERTASDDWPDYYDYHRQLIFVQADLSRTITNHLQWTAGIGFQHYAISDYGTTTSPTLLGQYLVSGLIHADETKGGSHLDLRAGIIYDSRDNRFFTTQGFYANTFLTQQSDLARNRYHNLRLNASMALFHHLGKADSAGHYRCILALQGCYQGFLSGQAAFYTQQNINTLFMRTTSSEGLGGIGTIRGLPYNRLLGNGYLWGNLEVRIRLFNFRFLKRDIQVVVNPLLDAGAIVQPYRTDEYTTDINTKARQAFLATGIGGKLVVNQNFIFGFEIAKALPLTHEDYPLGINLGLNYIF